MWELLFQFISYHLSSCAVDNFGTGTMPIEFGNITAAEVLWTGKYRNVLIWFNIRYDWTLLLISLFLIVPLSRKLRAFRDSTY